MTDDIVTRLREMWNQDPWATGLLTEAADEIERLRAELQLAHNQIAIMASAKVEEEPYDCLFCDGYGYVCAMGRRTCPDCEGTGERTEEQRNFVRKTSALRAVQIAEIHFVVSDDQVEVRGD